MTSDQEATNKLLYSWNEGDTWEELEISETPFEITNIIIEPTNTALSFLVHGKKTVVAIDFTSLNKRNCQGIDNPDNIDSDYELWSPNDESNPKCLMGKRVTYERRKREAECFNTQNFERKLFIQNCECTEEDWECDLGFERKNQGPCTHTKSLQYINPNEEFLNCSVYYYITQGYRKVAGDACIGGVDHSPIRVPCSRNGKLNSSNIYILVILAVLIVLILLIGTENKFKAWIMKVLNQKENEFRKFEDFTQKNFDGENMMEEKNEKIEELEDDKENKEEDNQQIKKLAERGSLIEAKKNIPIIGKPMYDKRKKENN